MSEIKFSRGPWRVYRDLPTDVVVSQSGECILATLDCGCGDRSTQRANVHLIAAAPDLYGALASVMDEIKSCLGNEEYYFGGTDPFDRARAALAKARGETP